MPPRQKSTKISAAKLSQRRAVAAKKGWETRRFRAYEAQLEKDIAASEKLLRKPKVAAKRKKKLLRAYEAQLEKDIAAGEKLFRKLKVAAKRKKKRKKKVKEPCPKRIYARVVEQTNQWQIRKYNVSGIQHLSVKCLAKLIDQQIARGAYYFRFWWAGNAYHKETEEGRVRSTHLMDAERIQGEYGSTEKFLKKFSGPVLYYWFDLHGGPARVMEGL